MTVREYRKITSHHLLPTLLRNKNTSSAVRLENNNYTKVLGDIMDLSLDPLKRDAELNKIAKDFFKIDFENTEFHIVMLSTLISLLLKKGVITERELEDETQEIGQAYKLMKYRNNLQKSDDLEEK